MILIIKVAQDMDRYESLLQSAEFNISQLINIKSLIVQSIKTNQKYPKIIQLNITLILTKIPLVQK